MQPAKIPAGEYVPTADQRVLIFNVPWSHFETQLRLKGEAQVPRIAYLNGVLELMTPSSEHERIKSNIGRLLEAYALETDIEYSAYGSWLLKKAFVKAGVEPDECYVFGEGREKDVPDLAVEVVWTHGGIEKLEIYRRLGVREVWIWVAGKIAIYVLHAGHYRRAVRSSFLPDLDVEALTSFLDRPSTSQAIRAFRQWLKSGKPSLVPRLRRKSRA